MPTRRTLQFHDLDARADRYRARDAFAAAQPADEDVRRLVAASSRRRGHWSERVVYVRVNEDSVKTHCDLSSLGGPMKQSFPGSVVFWNFPRTRCICVVLVSKVQAV